jgi:hypothetical protein
MAISFVEKLGQVQTAVGLVEDFPWNCQIARVWPFMGIDGQAISYARLSQITVQYTDGSTNPAQELGATASTIAEHTDSPNGDDATFTLGELATRYAIPYSQADRYVFPNDLVAMERALAERRLLYRYFSRIGGYGSNADGDFYGLRQICAASQIVDLDSGGTPGAFTLAQLDEAYHLMSDGGGVPNAIMSHSRARRTWLDALYTAGTLPDYVTVEVDDPLRGRISAKLPAWHGTPWFVNDLIEVEDEADPTAVTPIFIMELGDGQAQGTGRGVTGIIPRVRTGDMFVHRESTDSSQGTGTAGQPFINVDCVWPVGLALGSSGALSILQNFELVQNTEPPA